MVASAEWDEFALRCSLAGIKPPAKPAHLSGGPAQRKMTEAEVAETIARIKRRVANLGINEPGLSSKEVTQRLADQGVSVRRQDPLNESRKGGARG